MWISSVDSSHLVTLITMHLFIVVCILLFSAVSNSIAESQIGPKVENPEESDTNNKQEEQPDDIMNGSKPDEEIKCWLTEDFTTQGLIPCEPCNDHDVKIFDYCGETGFKQQIQCKSGTVTYKSCPKTKWAIEKSFWTFEGVMLALGMCSGVVALIRRRKLDWKALERVRKQIANSV
ncbi:protein JTB-like [Amphiura filiformis]|uniref:protein JTB-like n=1 Tax=Amphiura filiformis TaxID=82378 RepID=UPI003B20DC89